MKYTLFILLLSYNFCLTANASIPPIMVTNQSIKITGEQRFFYAFDQGDNIIINISLLKGKDLKEFEVIAYPHSSQYKGLKIKGIQNKEIRVISRGIYEFRILAGGSKTIQFTIQRQPSHDSKTAFDTNVKWRTVTDTIRKNYSEKITLSYDTAWVNKQRKIIKRIDTIFSTLSDRQERIAPYTTFSGDNSTIVHFRLPKNKIETLAETKVISWAYWIGVGQTGLDNYNKELRLFLLKASGKLMSKNLLAGVALGVYALAVNPPEGDNVLYEMNLKQQHISNGNITSVFGRETKNLQGQVGIRLTNDNIINGINVAIKVVAVSQQKIYEWQTYQERIITPIKNLETKGKIILKKRKVPYI